MSCPGCTLVLLGDKQYHSFISVYLETMKNFMTKYSHVAFLFLQANSIKPGHVAFNGNRLLSLSPMRGNIPLKK